MDEIKKVEFIVNSMNKQISWVHNINNNIECFRQDLLTANNNVLKHREYIARVNKKIIDINLTGAFNLIDAILPILKTQKSKGQLALCGSVAGYIGLPNAQPYSATKAAIINLAESLYAEYQQIIDAAITHSDPIVP